jgi:hypothetical protein
MSTLKLSLSWANSCWKLWRPEMKGCKNDLQCPFCLVLLCIISYSVHQWYKQYVKSCYWWSRFCFHGEARGPTVPHNTTWTFMVWTFYVTVWCSALLIMILFPGCCSSISLLLVICLCADFLYFAFVLGWEVY